MNKEFRLFLTLIFSSIVFSVSAQTEICDNGIDDDGDGFIDCFDGECATDGACDDFFFGNVVECADDIDVSSFAIRLQWGSEDRSSNSHATPMVGDLDGNGIPEVVATNKQRRSVFILNGANGETLFSNTSLGFQPENVPVLGDIDRDEFGEILVSQDRGDDLALLDHEANVIWSKKASINDAIGLPGFADFDEDGDVEIYYRNEIVDALTGDILIAGTNTNWRTAFTHGSLAVDVLDDAACADCAGLELVSGNEIWAINESSATRTLIRDMDDDIHANIDPNLNYYPKYYPNWNDQWSAVSAADYNLDGSMDLIITGALGTSSETYTGETTIFLWDVANGNVITFHDPSNNFVRGPGRVNIGDVDGDGQLNANFVMNQKLYSLDENFNIHWIRPIKEGSSGFTGCSLFDFDGDGAVEVTYRSEESLLIIDGIGNGDNTTNIRREIACVSRTQEEYPVIADVDGDGSSEICLACYTNNNTPFNPYSNTEFAQVRVYESDGESWMPARGVWNQHAYYNVNVNDDLTIPIEVQDHTRVFSDGLCEFADGTLVPFPSRPLNTFINQAPILNEDGCVEFASPDIEFVGILNATDAACPDATIDVTYEVRNIGDIAISGNLPVSYYAGDPREATGSTLLDTEVTTLVNFEPETTLEITQTITGIGGEFELFVVINDNGSTPPITVPLPTATIPECNTENNIQSTNVGFTRFDLIAEKLNDNRKCDDALPDNGSARAYYFGVVPAENGSIWVENFEDRTNSDKSDMDETGWTSVQGSVNPSFFGVNDFNGSKMFSGVRTGNANDNGEVTWTSEAIDISDFTDVTLTLDLFESGKQESSGKWRDFIIASYELRDNNNAVTATGELTNGRKFGNFDYAQALLTGINNAGQNDSLLTITVIIHNTSTSEFHYIDNVSVQGTPVPVPTIQTEADGFVFNWYDLGDTTNVIYTGSTFPQLAEGDYIVEGFYGPTLCFSALDTITIDRVRPEVYVWSYEVSQQTRCINPDGAAFAFAYTQTEDGSPPPATLSNPPGDTLLEADGYEVTWTLDGDLFNTVLATGNLLEDRQGPFTYRYTILDQFTGCVGDSTQLINSIAEEVTGLNMSATNIMTCGGTGEVSATVNGNTSDYTFEWYDGAGLKPAVDFTGPDYTVNAPGYYTVIATDNTTGCQTPIDSILVVDEANAPILTANATQANTTCGPNPTGIAEAVVNGLVGQSGFEYTWFDGANTLAENEIPDPGNNTAAFGVGEWEMANLSAGVYTIIVEETATNCTDTTTVTVVDDIVDPTFTIGDVDIVPNTSCNSSNGSIDASGAISPVSSYTFSLYSGFVVDAGNLEDNNSTGIFTGLASNSYTISAMDITNECPADPITVFVGNELDNPVIVATPSPDSFCTDGDGQIAVTSSSNAEPGSYTYEIFDGFSFSNEITAISDISVSDGSAGHTFTSLEDGNYRIRVTNDNLGCDSFEDVVVGDVSVNPTFSATRIINDNTSCDALNPNGFVSVSIDVASFDANDYTFSWWEGTDTSVPEDFGPTVGLNSLEDVAAGDYTVIAVDNATGCTTVELTLTVGNDPYIPNIVIQEDAPQTDCGTGNGILSAYVDNNPDLPAGTQDTDGFSFQWQLDGVDLEDGVAAANGSIPSGAETSTVSGLAADEYTLVVIHDNTDCPATESFTLSAAQINPVVAFASRTPNTVCDDTNPAAEYTGSVTVTSTFDGSDFTNDPNATYTWYDGDDTSDPEISGENGPTLSNRQEGFYTVIVRNSSTLCPSTPITVEVLEDHDEPVIAFTGIIGNSVCDPSLADDSSNDYNGEITASVTGGSGTYSYQWSSALDGLLVGETNATLSTVIHGSYTVEVKDDINGCVVSLSENIPDTRNDPTLLLANVVPTDVSVCTGGTVFPNGTVTVNEVDGFGPTDPEFLNYSFEWFVGAGTGTPIAGESSATISNRGVGQYTVRAVNDVTGCTSATRTVEIEESLIDINAADVIQHLTDCGTPNGSIQVTASMAAGDEPGGYTFEWFFGSGVSEPLDASDLVNGSGFSTSTSGTDQATASGLEDGTYTVRITNNDTQCDDTFEYDIENNQIIPTLTSVDIDVTNNTICDPGLASSGVYDGIIDPTNAVDPPLPGTTYVFELFDASNVSQGTSSTTFTNVAPGNYTVVATIEDVAGNVNGGAGCSSTSAAVVVGNDLTLPDFDLTGNPDVFCNAENGSIDISFTASVPADGFEIEIFTNPGATASQEVIGTAVNSFPVSSTANLTSQTYYVRFINNTTGCSAIEPVFVDEVLDQPTVDSATPTADNFCDGDNGTITVVGSNLGTDPLYSLYSGPDAVGTPTTTQASNVFDNLGTGTYTVTITKNDAGESGCESDGETVFVGEVLDVVTPTLTVVNEQTSCDGNNPNGRLIAGATNTLASPAPVFTFTFFKGSTTNADAEVTNPMANIPTASVSGNQADGLPAGLYTVLAENTTTGCTETMQETIQSMPTLPQITSAAESSPNTTCTAPFTGEITVTADDNGSVEPLDGANGYTFELYTGSSINIGETPFATINENDGDATFTELEDGDYMVRVIDNNTSCEVETTVPITVTYNGPEIDPAIDLSPGIVNPTDCFVNSGEIDLTGLVSVINGTGNITVSWYEGFDIGGSAILITDTETLADDDDLITGIVPGPITIPGGTLTNYRIQDVPAVNYAALLTLDNGCTDTLFINIPQDLAPSVDAEKVQDPELCSSPSDGEIAFDITFFGGDVEADYEYVLYRDVVNVPNDGDGSSPYDPAFVNVNTEVDRTTIPDDDSGAGQETVNIGGLDPGTYTLIIINSGDECPVFSEVFTLNEPDRPDLSTPPTVVNNPNCGDGADGGAEYDGSIAVSVTHSVAPAVFTFDWYTVDESTDPDTYTPILDLATSVNGDPDAEVSITNNPDNSLIEGLGELSGGLRYAVIATHTGTGCADTLHIDLFDDPTPIIVSGTESPITACTPGATGGFTVDTFNPAGTYEFEFFDGTSLLAASAVASKLDYTTEGDYYVIVTNTDNGCSEQLDFTVENTTVDPIITLNGGITDNTRCSGGPLGLNPNGGIDAQITNDDGGTYAYRWYLGDLAAYNASTAPRLEDGVDPGNGSSPTGAGTIALDDGTLTISGLAAGTYTLEVLDTDGISIDCSAAEDFVIADDLADITIEAVATTPQIFCNPDENGTATIANVLLDGILTDATTANVEFRWFDDNVGTALSVGTQGGTNNSQVTNLPSGNYFVDVYNEDTDCVSDLVAFEILNEEAFPAVQVTQVRRDSLCAPNNGSGSILASVTLEGTPPTTDDADEYSYAWYQGAGNAGDADFLLNAPVGVSVTATGYTITAPDGEQVDNLPAGTYEVVVTNNAGGTTGDNCSTTASITIDQFTPVISISDADITVTPNENCSPDQGGAAEVTRVTVTTVDGGSYFIDSSDPEWANLSFEWYDDPTGGIAQDNDERYESLGLDDETYYVIVSDWSTTGCNMPSRKEVIVPDDVPPITLTLTEDAPDNFCNPVNEGNGQISLAIDIDGTAEDETHYTIEWFVGSGTGTSLNATSIPGSSFANNDLTVNNIPDGDYTVRVTKNGAGATTPALSCVATAEITLSGEEEEITLETDVDFTRAPNTVCDPALAAGGAYTGSIDITDITEGGSKVGGIAGYSFVWTGENGAALPAGATGATTATLGAVPAGIYEVTITNDTRDCSSEVIPIPVLEDITIPTQSLTASNTNVNCDGATVLTGSLEVTAAPGTGTYTFAWFQGESTSGTAITTDIVTASPVSTASNLDGGFYTVVATETASGCTVTGTYFVDEDLDIPTLDVFTVQGNAEPDSLCTGNSGTITINAADISGNDLSAFDFTITEVSGGTIVAEIDGGAITSGATVTSTDPIIIEQLASGDYNIDAVNRTTNCEIATGLVNIGNTERDPLVTLERLESDQNCGAGATNAGEIEVRVDGRTTPPAFITFAWSAAGGGAVIPVGVVTNQASLIGVPEGDYQVTVTNTNTGCDIVRTYTVPNISIVPIISETQINANTNCTPSIGSFELVEVIYDDVTYTDGGANDLNGIFELEVFRSSDNGSVEIVASSPYLVDTLAAADYFAFVRHIATSCTSEQIDFTIEDLPNLPEVVLTLNEADSTCQTGFSPNGTVTALANGLDDTDADFTFQWYFGAVDDIGGTAIQLDGTALANGSVPVGFDESTISGLATGTYSVEVSQASNGCVVRQEIAIPNVPAEVEIISVDVVSSTDCLGNGVIEITEVQKNGVSDNLANYTFAFYTTNPGILGATPVFTSNPADGPIYDEAVGDLTYFIVGTHIEFGCTTSVFQTEVPENIERPVIDLTDFDRQSNCDPDNPNGTLTVLADGQPENATYNFQWYFGSNTTDSLTTDDYRGGQNLTGEGTNAVRGLGPGFYTVEVLNNNTGCTTTETFEMVSDTPDEFALSTSVSPNTSCSEPNGRVAASVLNPVRDEDTGEFRDYNFFWYFDPDQATADNALNNIFNFSGSSIEGLPQGNYYVLALDATDPFCNSVVERVEVLDFLTPPAFDIASQDVTVCFEDKNGFAEVIIDDLSTVTITWRDDMNDSIGSTFFIDSLDAGLYSVEVVDNISQCSNEMVVEIFNNAVIPNAPFVLVNNVRNNCSLTNGSAIANVDGVTNNFLFEWFDPLDLNTPYATGAAVSNLDSITYLVRATDITTGCESPFTQVDIGFEEVVPEFVVVVDNSICLRTEDGATNQFTGSAFLQFSEFNLPVEFEWTFLETNEVVSTDARLIDAFPGNYRVRVVADNGCEYFREFSIDVTLNIYNGVSSNGDGKNDFFLIDCIDYFPGNNVKIFNRAGQRIYEVDGYDNRDVRFEGVSNVGGGGLVLPSGTYFYLVDLGTGDDPIQGYLELVR